MNPPPLQTFTWDQAAILRAWPPNAFQAIGINPATIRQWAKRGHIHPIGKGPNGCKLYDYETVARHAVRNPGSVLANDDNNCHTGVAPKTPMPRAAS